jgi:hypothetical protein
MPAITTFIGLVGFATFVVAQDLYNDDIDYYLMERSFDFDDDYLGINDEIWKRYMFEENYPSLNIRDILESRFPTTTAKERQFHDPLDGPRKPDVDKRPANEHESKMDIAKGAVCSYGDCFKLHSWKLPNGKNRKTCPTNGNGLTMEPDEKAPKKWKNAPRPVDDALALQMSGRKSRNLLVSPSQPQHGGVKGGRNLGDPIVVNPLAAVSLQRDSRQRRRR